MPFNPYYLIATSIRRYLNPPGDQEFWNEVKAFTKMTPDDLLLVISKYIDLDFIDQNPLIHGDRLLVDYLRTLGGQTEDFPITEGLAEYEKKWFTPDDNDFYNRLIYESEIEELKKKNLDLKLRLDDAIKAKNDFVMRDYELVRALGIGGFGTVSLVRHKLSNALFAIKRLHSTSPENQENILREISSLAPITHPNIIRYQHSFNANGLLYLVMEYCPGGSLQDLLDIERRLDEDRLTEVFLTLTKALSFLHKKGIVHHDLKPSNILIDGENILKISDFGCINTDFGTPAFIAPELSHSLSYISDPRTDIYSLGVTLMVCALGYNPFAKKSPDEIEMMLKLANLPLHILPYWLQDTIYKAVNIDLNARFQSMDEFHTALLNRNIPRILSIQDIELEKAAARLNMMIRTRRWTQARNFVSFYPGIEQNLNLVINTGTFYLKTHQLDKARSCFEKALKLNPNAGIEKQLAEVYLQAGDPNKATTILTNYVNRNFSDIEAHNQLLYAYFISERWELGLEQADLVTQLFPKESLFVNNFNLFCILTGNLWQRILTTPPDTSFSKYNLNVYNQNTPAAWYAEGKPALKSKLLFQEYKFRDIHKNRNTLEVSVSGKTYRISEPIITFGREGYDYNTFSTFNGTSISRRHFLLINMKNNVWLYDLDSATGVYIDGQRVKNKAFLLGLHKLEFGNFEIEVKSDSEKLI